MANVHRGIEFNRHPYLEGKHAFLSPSSYHWMNYDDEKLDNRYLTHQAARRGVELHDLAHDLIRLGVKLPKTKATLNMYVNDAIGYRMTPEQALYYSDNSFGTADAISFRNNKLRIHDLKTGETPTSELQLYGYAALFCLEYRFKPVEIEIECRIYQSDECRIYEPSPHEITQIMSTIVTFDKRIESMKSEIL